MLKWILGRGAAKPGDDLGTNPVGTNEPDNHDALHVYHFVRKDETCSRRRAMVSL